MVPSREICHEKILERQQQWIPEGFEFPDSVGLVVFSFCIKVSHSSYTQQQFIMPFPLYALTTMVSPVSSMCV